METARARVEAGTRRDALLQALAFAAQRFLEEPSLERGIDAVLQGLGEAAEVSRAYVLENREPRAGRLVTVLRALWLAPDAERTVEVGTELGYEDLERWVDVLSRGEVVVGPISSLPPGERIRLEPHGIRSLLLVPVLVDGAWWGYIGFDDCRAERDWTPVEVDALRAAGGTLASAINRGRAETAVREAEERFRTIVETTPAITYQEHVTKDYEHEGSVIYVSPQVERILGYSAKDWAEVPGFWTTLIHPDDREAVLRESERTSQTGERYRQEYRMIAADGRVVWFRDESVLIRDEADEPQMWQGVMVDITEAKEAEDRRNDAEMALAETEERYRLLVERSPIVIYVQDVDPVSGGSVTTYLSPGNEDLVGYSAEEVAADPSLWTRLIHPDDRERVLATDRESNASGRDFSMEYRMIHRDGRIVWIHDVATLVESHGRTSWQGFMLDVTERKEAEDKLERALAVEREAAKRLRAVDEMKNTFLQAVSHDLRTPLAAILGLAITLERSEIALDVQEVRDLAHRIASNARKLDRLVTDLLDLDRLARGIVEPKLHPADVSEIVGRVVAESELSSSRRVSVQAEPVVASVDAAKVERIVENLLVNAFRHTPSKARVWVRVEPSDGGVLLVVEDEGPGVPAGMRDVLFQPFRQGEQTGDHAPGVGVGLALVSRFAELMGGRAWVEERPGGGSSFRVYLADGPRTTSEVGSAG